MNSLNSCRRTVSAWAGPILGTLFLAVVAGSAAAHLSIIRHGPESTGDYSLNDRFGSTLVAGDFNGDGIQDLATAATGENLAGQAGAGNVTISFGSYFGLTHEGAVDLDVNHWFRIAMTNSIEESSGIKRGWTSDSGTATAYTADGTSGPAVVTTLATPDYGGYGQTAIDMMELGLGECFEVEAGPWDGSIYYLEGGIHAVANESHGISGLFETTSGDYQFDLFFMPGREVPQVLADITIGHTSYLTLEYGQSTTLGTSPLGWDQGARVTNTGGDWTYVYLNGTGYSIGPGETIALPPRGDSDYWEVENGGEVTAQLMIEESYLHSLEFSHGGGEYPPDPIFTANLARRDYLQQDLFSYSIEWLSTGGEFLMAMHDASVVVSAPEPGEAQPQSDLLEATSQVFPNPSQAAAGIALQLSRGAEVGLTIFDASGRRIRGFPSTAWEAGRTAITWDGLSDRGDPVPPGVYFYRFQLDHAATIGGRIVRIE